MEVKTSTRRTQAERTAATRSTLLASARKLFATKGFGEVSTQEIVAEAGVTRGALYHQFADKTELFAAVYEEVEAQLVAEIAGLMSADLPTDPVAAMRLGVRAFLDRCSEPDVERIVLVDAPAVLGWDRWRQIGARYGLGAIEAMLGQAVEAGAIPAQPLRPTAHILLGALDEAALYISRADDPVRAREDMYAVCDRIFRGLAAPD